MADSKSLLKYDDPVLVSKNATQKSTRVGLTLYFLSFFCFCWSTRLDRMGQIIQMYFSPGTSAKNAFRINIAFLSWEGDSWWSSTKSDKLVYQVSRIKGFFFFIFNKLCRTYLHFLAKIVFLSQMVIFQMVLMDLIVHFMIVNYRKLLKLNNVLRKNKKVGCSLIINSKTIYLLLFSEICSLERYSCK